MKKKLQDKKKSVTRKSSVVDAMRAQGMPDGSTADAGDEVTGVGPESDPFESMYASYPKKKKYKLKKKMKMSQEEAFESAKGPEEVTSSY